MGNSLIRTSESCWLSSPWGVVSTEPGGMPDLIRAD